MTSTATSAQPQIILVTGGSRGIGQAYVARMDQLGHHVVTVSRTPADGAAGLRNVAAIEGDVTTAEAAQTALDYCLERFGRIDVLVNNAGGSMRRSAEAKPGTAAAWDFFDETLRLNLLSQIMFCDVVAPAMTSAGRGRILNISSSGGRSHARVADAAYCAAKAGVVGLTRQLAYQLGPHGILVNAIAPGTTLASDRVRARIGQLEDEARRRILDDIPLRRFADSDDVVGPMEFLTVGPCGYITGVVLDVNGGFFMA